MALLSPLILHGKAEGLLESAGEIRMQLMEKILPYWFDTAQDGRWGGYLLNDDAVVGRREPLEKQIVTQSRMVWGFSHAHLAGFNTRDYLQAAKQGYQFLLAHFLDRRNGGYFWSSDLKGKWTNDSKFLYGQAFVIYAFVEYYRASSDVEALRYALELYRTIQAHLHDNKNSGWFEQADRQWRLLSPNDRRNQFERSDCKTANAHLHWMEALAELYDVSRDPAVRESLIEALQLNQIYFFPESPGQYAAWWQFDWKPVIDSECYVVPYGHNVEFAWLMIRAETLLNWNLSWERFYALLNHALQYGFDETRGGVYNRGLEDQPAIDTEKIWWVQAEMLMALTVALNHQSNVRYEVALDKLLNFINSYLVNPKDGIWLHSVTADGHPKETVKANSWKANYHDVRAMLKFAQVFDNP